MLLLALASAAEDVEADPTAAALGVPTPPVLSRTLHVPLSFLSLAKNFMSISVWRVDSCAELKLFSRVRPPPAATAASSSFSRCRRCALDSTISSNLLSDGELGRFDAAAPQREKVSLTYIQPHRKSNSNLSWF